MKWTAIFLCCLIGVALDLRAAAPLVLRDTTQSHALGPHWDVLPWLRHEKPLSLAQVRAPSWAARFRPSGQQVPNFAQLDADIWLRCQVRNAAGAGTRWVLRTNLSPTSSFELFVVDAAGRVHRQEVSNQLPFRQTHLVPEVHFNLLLSLPPGQTSTLYLLTGANLLDFSIVEEGHFRQLVRQREIGATLYFGTLLTLLLYNLLLFASVRDRSYLYYVLYVGAFGLLQADMMGYLHLALPTLSDDRQNGVQLVLMGLAISTGVLTARSFLETRRLVPRLDPLLRSLLALAPLPWLGWLLGLHPLMFWLRVLVPVLTCVVLVVAGVAVLRTRYQPARYYIAGWALLIVAIIAYYLRTINVLPVSFLTEYGVRISSVLEMLLLSLGLASRINLARQAQQQAQAQAMAVMREKEEVQQAANQKLAARADELRLAYDELQASLATTDQLQTLDELKTRFFTNISHELRTPLTLILSPLEQLLTEPAPRPELRPMHRNAQRLLHLISQLLDIARLEAGQLRLLAVPTDLGRAVHASAEAFAPLAQARQVALLLETVAPSPAAPPLYADADKLEQILYNLLSNALKFTPAGGQVRLSVAYDEQYATVAVQDTGIGIAAADLPGVFERFRQGGVGRQRQYGGSGVGLALVRELAALHGGAATARSTVGEGSTFVVRLALGTAHLAGHDLGPAPLPDEAAASAALVPWRSIAAAELTPEPDETALREEALTAGAAADARPLLLIVDDSADLRHYLRQCLQADYRLLLAADGEQGLARAQAAMPDLVVSDLMMPGLDGQELCRRLKTDERTSHIPIVLLTALTNDTARLVGLENGADDYLTKPFRPAELRARVRNLIAGRQQLRERFGREVTLQPRAIRLTSVDEQFVNRALAVVEANLANPEFSAEAFAAEMALSRMQLHRKLKALTDQSATEFVRTLRLQRAAQLLAAGAANVAEAAEATGFINLSHFARGFRELHGQLPSVFAAARAK